MQRLVRQLGESSPVVARAAIDTARFYYSAGLEEDARRWLERSLAAAESPAAHEWMATVAPGEALPHLERAIDLYRRAGGAPSADEARAHTRLANWYEAHKAPKLAVDEHRAAVAVYEKLLLPGGAAAPLSPLAVALNDLGLALESQADAAGGDRASFAEAERLYRRALAIQERHHGPRHGEVGITLNNLAGSIGAQGRLAEAEPILRRALSILDATFGPAHSKSANCASNLADLLSALGRRGEAGRLYARAIAAFEAAGDTAAAAEAAARASATAASSAPRR